MPRHIKKSTPRNQQVEEHEESGTTSAKNGTPKETPKKTSKGSAKGSSKDTGTGKGSTTAGETGSKQGSQGSAKESRAATEAPASGEETAAAETADHEEATTEGTKQASSVKEGFTRPHIDPFVFNLALAKLPDYIPCNMACEVHVAITADDIALLACGPGHHRAALLKCLHVAIDAVDAILSGIELDLAASKAEALLVQRKRRNAAPRFGARSGSSPSSAPRRKVTCG
ncbi:hypothetical protein MRX96_009610 [Rhipicephalus microplus]